MFYYTGYFELQQIELQLKRENEQLRKQNNSYKISLNRHKKFLNNIENREYNGKPKKINVKQNVEQVNTTVLNNLCK